MRKLVVIIIIVTVLIIGFFGYISYPSYEPLFYPQPAGKDSKTGLPLEKIYFCMDICPDYKAILTVYKGVDTEEKCEQIGGQSLLTGEPSPGAYIACSPQ